MGERSNEPIIDCEFAYINTEQNRTKHSNDFSRAGDSPRIVVVEDNQMILDYVVAALESAGFIVFAFSDAESAIPFFKKHGSEISVAIVDDILPKLHGHELIKKIRSDTPKTKIILTSGYYSDDSRSPTTDSNVALFLHKPYNVRVLLEKVNSLLPKETAPTLP